MEIAAQAFTCGAEGVDGSDPVEMRALLREILIHQLAGVSVY